MENETTVENQKLHARLERELKSAKESIRNEIAVLEQDLQAKVRSI